jgi:hypothetical protein
MFVRVSRSRGIVNTCIHCSYRRVSLSSDLTSSYLMIGSGAIPRLQKQFSIDGFYRDLDVYSE